MNDHITQEDRQWIANQVYRFAPQRITNNAAFANLISDYVENGTVQNALGSGVVRVIRRLEATIDENHLHDEEKAKAFVYENLPEWLGNYSPDAGRLLGEMMRQGDPLTMSEADKQQVAMNFVKGILKDQSPSPEGEAYFSRLFAYYAEHGMPNADNPREMRRYLNDATRHMHPNASDAEIQQMVEQNWALYNQNRRQDRFAGIKFFGCFGGFFLVLYGTIALAIFVLGGGLDVLATYWDIPAVRALNWTVFLMTVGVSLFFFVRRKLDTRIERVQLALSAVLFAGIFLALWYSGLLDAELGEQAVTLRDSPELLLTVLMMIFGGVVGAAVWVRRRLLTLLFTIGAVGVLSYLLLMLHRLEVVDLSVLENLWQQVVALRDEVQ